MTPPAPSRSARSALVGLAAACCLGAVAGLSWVAFSPAPPCEGLDAEECFAALNVRKQVNELVAVVSVALGLAGGTLALVSRDRLRGSQQ